MVWSLSKVVREPIQTPISLREGREINKSFFQATELSVPEFVDSHRTNSITLPWFKKNCSAAVALTGPAFRLIEQMKDSDPYLFKSVLSKT